MVMSTQEIEHRLQAVRSRIAAAESLAGRPPGSVTLVAVTKGHPVSALLVAAGHGQTRFGESYVQEALPKIGALTGHPFEWHFIGALQANKTKRVSGCFHWVHSLDSIKVARRMSAARPADMRPLEVCIQVNIDRDPAKVGVSTENLPELIEAVAVLPHLRLRGLMTMPVARRDFEQQRAPFRALREVRDRLRETTGMALDTLSMGISDDLEAAVVEGATVVRIGTAIFGAREVP
jgi:pyridoxal phosphate enzyme (YggS family)